MHDTGCLGLVHWDDPEGWYGEGSGRGVQDGDHIHSEVSYILATSKMSQEDGPFFDLRSADVPVRVQDGLKFNCILDFFLVEDKSLFHIPLGVDFGVYFLQQNRNKHL